MYCCMLYAYVCTYPSKTSRISTPVVLSNEVLLRSKIAQLQLEKVKQQSKSKSKNKSHSSAVASTSSSSSSATRPEAGGQQPADATRGSSGTGARPARKGPSTTSKHRLASDEAGCGRGEKGKGSTSTASGTASGGAEAGLPEKEEDVMRRFEAQVMRMNEVSFPLHVRLDSEQDWFVLPDGKGGG